MNHFSVILVVIFSTHVFSVGGTNPKYRQVKYCNIPVNQSFICGESEYRCQYRCTVNSKCNLYSVGRIHSSCYRCVFHICTNQTVDCQGNWGTNCSGWKTYIKDGSGKEKYIWWYHMYNLKNMKKNHGGVLILMKLQALA